MFGFFGRKPEEPFSAEEIRTLLMGITRRWNYFRESVHFKSGVSLATQLELFLTPTIEFIKSNHPKFYKRGMGELEFVITSGISLSGSHTKEQIAEAFESLRTSRRPM